MKSKDLWPEFTVYEMNPTFGHKIPLCGLCSNTGMVDTTTTAKCFGKCIGVKSFCICPNGRTLKKHDKKKA